MRKLFIDKISGDTVLLTGEDNAHLSKVLRAKMGDEVVLCPQDGYDYFGEIVGFGRDCATVKIKHKRPVQTEPALRLTLYCALLKGDKAELVVQKAVELGASAVVFFHTQNAQARAESLNLTRLQKIAHEAAKQCGRGCVPKISGVLTFEQAAEQFGGADLKVFPYENAERPALKEFLEQAAVKAEKEGRRLNSAAIIVGSEGGFSPAEAERLAAHTVAVTLGKRIMRAETACIAVVSAVMFYMDEWR